MGKKKLSYVSIMGGIGDQIFQFSFANYLRNKINSEVILDISYYQNILNYNKFKFRLKNLSKTENFKYETQIFRFNYKYLSYLRILELFGVSKYIPIIYSLFFNFKINHFIYEYWKTKENYQIMDNSYYFGYWHKLKYAKPIKQTIQNNLFKPILKKKKLKNFIQNKLNKKNVVSIHIRGGDFKILKSHNVLSSSYYNDSINFYSKKLKDPIFHIFTNDMLTARKILKDKSKKKNFIFIKDLKLNDIEEFSLFSEYKYAIIANSTFSLMSSYLSHKRLLSVAPKVWLKGKALDKEKKFKNLIFI